MAKNYVDFQEAIESSMASAYKTTLTQIISIENALGRVFAQDIDSKKNLPSFNNSAMDGFAVNAEDAGNTLLVKESIYAGDAKELSLSSGECFKIMTGAKVPSCVNSVVPIENVQKYEDNKVTLPNDISEGYAVRLKGEEVSKGTTLFKEGQEVTAGAIAVLASQGIVNIEVYKQISIAVVSTGSELKEPWEDANEDEIYNCNSYGIISVLNSKGFNASYIKVIPDNLDDTIAFVLGLKNYDVIITSGGISMGDADFVGRAFEANGLETLFDGINIKPGKPIMMGSMQNSFVICLPGNPLTAMLNLYTFAIPILRKIQGFSAFNHNFEKATNMGNFKARSGRVNLVLGTLSCGEFKASRANKYGSGMITVVEQSNSLVLTGEESNGCKDLDSVKVLRFDGSFVEKTTNVLN
jgi:molybdopterin molybdotransferase